MAPIHHSIFRLAVLLCLQHCTAFSCYTRQSTQSSRSSRSQTSAPAASVSILYNARKNTEDCTNTQSRRDVLVDTTLLTTCVASTAPRKAVAVAPPQTMEGLGGTKQRIQGIGGGFDISTPNASNLASSDAYYPSSMSDTRWKVQRVVTSVEGDAGQACTIWTLLGGSNEKAFTSQLTESYTAYFIESEAEDAIYQYDGRAVKASVLDRATTLSSRVGIDSSSILWERDRPQQTLRYSRNTNNKDTVKLSVLQRKNELSEAGFGSDELLKLTSTTLGGTIDRACRIKSRYRRGFDETTGKRIIDGLEIVTTYRVLDGVAGIEMHTSTCKSRIRLTEL